MKKKPRPKPKTVAKPPALSTKAIKPIPARRAPRLAGNHNEVVLVV